MEGGVPKGSGVGGATLIFHNKTPFLLCYVWFTNNDKKYEKNKNFLFFRDRILSKKIIFFCLVNQRIGKKT